MQVKTQLKAGQTKQEIQDLLMLNRAVRMGLIVFASVPHVIAPITEDTETIRKALPALDTELYDPTNGTISNGDIYDLGPGLGLLN